MPSTDTAGVSAATTIGALLRRSAERWPHEIAALEPTGQDDRTLTFRELAEQVALLRMRLREHGLGRGDVAVAWLPNGLENLVFLLACATAGIDVVGANTRYREHELAHILRQARPRLIVHPERLLDLDFAGVLSGAFEDAAQDEGWTRPGLCVVPEDPEAVDRVAADHAAAGHAAAGSDAWTWAVEAGPPGSDRAAEDGGPHDDGTDDGADDGRPDDLWLTFTTSGSTGMPKLAAHDQWSVAHHTWHAGEVIGLRPGSVFLGVLPLSGVFGLVPVLGSLWHGATTLLYPVFGARQVLDDISRHGVTHVIGGDDLVGALHDAWDADPADLSSLRHLGMADFEGRVPRLAEWVEATTDATVCGVYGSSEVFSLLTVQPQSLPSETRLRGGGVLVSSSCEARAVDLVSREPLPAGEQGELQVRGPQVLQRYLTAGGAVPPSLDDGGWFDTGDLGIVSADGRDMEYRGRIGDALRLRGFLVQPSEIEAVVSRHDSVGLVKVVEAQVDERAAAVAFVTARDEDGVDPEDVRRFCAERVAAFKVPARVVVVDSMPTTTGTNGTKIKAAELRERARRMFG